MTTQIGKDFLLEWNYQFPLDRWWRKKYNISLFSSFHLESNQLDIALEYLEDHTFEEIHEKVVEYYGDEKDYKDGIWIKPISLSTGEEVDLFTNLDFSKLNESIKENNAGS